MKKIIIVVTVLITGIAGAQAQTSDPDDNGKAIQLSLTPDVALYPRTATIDGVSLNIWGENPQHGFTLGLVNGSTGDSAGFSCGIVNYDESYRGVQWGVVNYSQEEFVGWQRGVVNISKGQFTGYQEGVVNVSDQTKGFQLGLVNYSGELDGLQIGLVNLAFNNPWFNEFPDKLAPGFPILNWSF